MASYYKLPIIPEPRVRRIDEPPTMSDYEEVIYDHRTMRYYTRSQQLEIDTLKKQLYEKEKKRNESLKSIIGYFYKVR